MASKVLVLVWTPGVMTMAKGFKAATWPCVVMDEIDGRMIWSEPIVEAVQETPICLAKKKVEHLVDPELPRRPPRWRRRTQHHRRICRSLRTQDELLEEIFVLLPTAADLARASAACPSFRRLITDHAFLRRYRALHPPPLIGFVDDNAFVLAQPLHASAIAARTFAGFDFSCSSFLPSTAGRTWRAIDFLDGRALLTAAQSKTNATALMCAASCTTFSWR
ncbi:hypothetical protein VPH35_056532 [Triticum aestivum]